MMKIKRKGKIHPSPPLPPPSSPQPADSLSVLNLLPAAILALAAVLSLQDREVLAYMMTRSLKTSTTSSSSISSVHESKKLTKSKDQQHSRPPLFDCECFDCYTSFWFRWDSSPNRELIHQAIEAFEEHLATGELQSKRATNSRRNRKKEKLNQNLERDVAAAVVEIEAAPVFVEEEKIKLEEEEEEEEKGSEVEEVVVLRAATVVEQKGLVRKVLPDVLGVFNSRLWNLWGTNV